MKSRDQLVLLEWQSVLPLPIYPYTQPHPYSLTKLMEICSENYCSVSCERMSVKKDWVLVERQRWLENHPLNKLYTVPYNYVTVPILLFNNTPVDNSSFALPMSIHHFYRTDIHVGLRRLSHLPTNLGSHLQWHTLSRSPTWVCECPAVITF